MMDAEFEYLLDVVNGVVSAPSDVVFDNGHHLEVLPTPANDNTMEWPHVPFPDGWTASC